MIVILSKEWRAGKEAGREKTNGAVPLDSAPPDSSDDSGPVLTVPPNRLGGTTDGDFGGRFRCTFRAGLRSSSERLPGYCLLPHLYQDFPTIASLPPQVNRSVSCTTGSLACPRRRCETINDTPEYLGTAMYFLHYSCTRDYI